jgi:predicted metalloprotease with PDZ domain
LKRAPRLSALLGCALLLAAPAAAEVGAKAAPRRHLPEPAPMPPPIAAPRDIPFAGTIRLEVDATDVVHRIFRIRETIPVRRPGAMTLLFPEWTPGDHAPNGPLDQFAGLMITANGQRLRWARDTVAVHAFHVDVPAGVQAIEAQYQFLGAGDPSQGRVVITSKMLDLQWQTAVLYPAGHYARAITYQPSVTLPAGWSFASALDGASREGDRVTFSPVSLDTLVDSPLLAGRYFKQLLVSADPVPVRIDLVADDEAELVAPPEVVAGYQKVVAEAYALFGSQPYEHYDFLVWLSDDFGPVYYEHRRSGENSGPASFLATWKDRTEGRDRIVHGFVHAWNGMLQRPAEMWTPNFNVPERDSLLWVFEGLTEYWRLVLSVRAGLSTQDDALRSLAKSAAAMASRTGAVWRPLADVNHDPIVSARKPLAWPGWQRTMFDAYTQGELIWLDVDALIRLRTHGSRSLDDFARRFFGGGVAGTYTLADLIAALNAVAPCDWTTFFRSQLDDYGTAGLEGIAHGGYQLVYDDAPSAGRASADFSLSLGTKLTQAGRIQEVSWEGAAYQAGLVAGGTVISVNDRPFAVDALETAIKAAEAGGPLTLRVTYGKETRLYPIAWRGGLRHPHLARVSEKPAMLDAILSPGNHAEAREP